MTFSSPTVAVHGWSRLRAGGERSRSDVLLRGVHVVLLLILFAQLLFSAGKSPTFDEPNHLARGYAYLKSGDLRFSRTTGHPPLLNVLCALPLLMLNEIGPPDRYPGWAGGFLNAFATSFVFDNPVPLPRLFFLGRLPTMGLTLLLAALVARWAGEQYGPAGGTLALVLCAFDPNLIAHGRLTTTDAGVAFFFVLTVYLFTRFLHRPSIPSTISTGVALGLAQCAKFSALLLVPSLALLAMGTLPSRPSGGGTEAARPWRHRLIGMGMAMAAMLVIAALTIWGVYGFAIGRPGGLALTLPAPQYVEGVRATLGRVSTESATFLLGRRLGRARWYYFPIALALKTPLPSLLFVALAILSNRLQPMRRAEWPLLLLPALYFAVAIRSTLNLGYRHLLPMLPFLWVYVGRVAKVVACPMEASHRGEPPGRAVTEGFPSGVRPPLASVSRTGQLRSARRRWAAIVVVLLVAWLIAGTLHVAPHYLAYFNEVAGGPSGGRRYLVDSNLDWGQDLYALARYARQHDDVPFYLSWFGCTYPYMYGVNFNYRHLPGHYAFPYSTDMARSSYNPLHPAPGLYAISITNLQMGVDEGDLFAFFRTQKPVARVGYSILIYRVEGERPKESYCLVRTDFEHFAPGVLRHSLGRAPGDVRWFEPGRSFVVPAADTATYVAPTVPLAFDPDRQQLFSSNATLLYEQRKEGPFTAERVYRLARVDELRRAFSLPSPPLFWSNAVRFDRPFDRHPLAAPVRWEYGLQLLGYRLLSGNEALPGDEVKLITIWRSTALMPPESSDLTAFVHLLDEEGRVCGSEDRLDLEPLSWQSGDIMVQLHRVPVCTDAAPGTYWLEVGLYLPRTMRRLQVYDARRPIADRLLLMPITVVDVGK